MTATRSEPAADVELDAIPQELRELTQWGLWRYANGTKMPLDIYGEPAKSNDPSTWSDFETVTERYAIADGFNGIAFFFSADDPYCGVDLDGCRNPDTGEVQQWATYWIDKFASYTEVSPSATGFKLICKGKNTHESGHNTKLPEQPKVSDKEPGVEIYDNVRFWTFTGWHVPTTPTTIEPAQPAIDEFLAKYWTESKRTKTASTSSGNNRLEIIERCWRYVQKMRDAISNNGGHNATFAAACKCFQFGLTDGEALEVIRRFNASKTGAEQWNEKEMAHKLKDAREKVTAKGQFGSMLREQPPANAQTQPEATTDPQPAPLAIRTIGELIDQHPTLRNPVIHGLLRQGETLNVISSPKVGKSWLVADLALSIVTSRKWLDSYAVEQGKVLIIDNELHPETIGYRIGKVADALELVPSDYADSLHVVTLRGCLTDIIELGPRVLDTIAHGDYRLIILDALYRAIPAGTDENNNSAIAAVYNHIDNYAMQLGCGFACVHHSTKGNQSAKAVTDVGAGAGSQARATDTHLILRPHAEDGAVVLDAAARSWAPVEPVALRWEWPLWTPDTDLDPAALRNERATQQEGQERAKAAKKKQAILDTYVHFPDGATERDIVKRVGRGIAFESAWQSLTNSGQLVECKVLKGNGHAYDGWNRVYDEDER